MPKIGETIVNLLAAVPLIGKPFKTRKRKKEERETAERRAREQREREEREREERRKRLEEGQRRGDWYIDVGTTQVRVLLANTDNKDRIQVIGKGFYPEDPLMALAPLGGLRKGELVKEQGGKLSADIQEAMRLAWRDARARVPDVRWPRTTYVSISSRDIEATNNSWTVKITNEQGFIQKADYAEVLEQARRAAVGTDREVIHSILRYCTLDGEVRVKNLPIREKPETTQAVVIPRARELSVEVHIVAREKKDVESLRAAFDRVRVDEYYSLDGPGVILVANALASGEGVVAEEERERGVIVADVGYDNTNIAVYKQGEIWHTAFLPIGSWHLTNDISRRLGFPLEVAEQIKIRHGVKKPREKEARAIIEVAEERYLPFMQEIYDILRARTITLLRMVAGKVPDYERGGPARLVLTGGAANLLDLKDFLRELEEQELEEKTPERRLRMGVPSMEGIYGLREQLYDPRYASIVGLLRWAAHYPEKNDLIGQDRKATKVRESRIYDYVPPSGERPPQPESAEAEKPGA